MNPPTLIFLFLALAYPMQAFAVAVDVFHASDRPVNTSTAERVTVRVHEVDLKERVEAQLSQGLPADSDRALDVARQRLSGDSGAQLIERLKDGADALIEAHRLGVEKVPAIVIDGTYVVYGETSVQEALVRFRQTVREGR